MLNFPYGSAPINCCGFFQPTIDLANSFRVDANGLPLPPEIYRQTPYTSDLGLTADQKTAYTVNTALALDPRIESTLGRRGIPFRDWGLMPGDAWIRDASNGGPFLAVKNTIEVAQLNQRNCSGKY
ncbi:hypothetical protein [Pedobacter sp. NJ-S-72]